jgi:hypothetical protein
MNFQQNPIVAAGNAERAHKAQTFTNWVACLMNAKPKGDPLHAAKIFEAKFPRSAHLDLVKKAGVSFGTTTDPSFAGPLAPLKPLADEFVNYIRPLTVIGRMQGFRALPFNVRVGRATSGSSVGWTGQGVPTLLSSISFEEIVFKISTISGIVCVTKELVRLADPSAERLILQDLAAATAQFSDTAFLDPTIAEVPDISPASITNGAPEVTSTGATLAAISADLSNLLAQITTNFSAIYLIMKRSTALGICKLKTASGGDAFPSLGVNGGFIWGIPVIVSDNVPSDANSPSDKMIVALDASEIFLNDEGIEIEASEQALLEMSTAPDSPRTASTVLVSLYAQNLVAVLVRRYIRWQRRREGSVVILTGVPF